MQQIQSNSGQQEYTIAFKSIRAAKNFAVFFLILSLLLQIGGTVVVHFTELMDEQVVAQAAAPPAPAADSKDVSIPPATQPDAKAGAEASPAGSVKYPWDNFEFTTPEICRVALTYGLPASRFIALVLGLMLVLMVMFAVKLSLVERIGGAAGFMSAFNWSLILLMMLIPWRQLLGSSLSCGALFNFTELAKGHTALGQAPEMIDQIFFYARFLAYPCAALLTWMIIQTKFARGLRVMKMRANESEAVAARVNPQVYPAQG